MRTLPAAALCCLLLVGCKLTKTEPKAAPQKVAKTVVTMEFRGLPDCNPNDLGEPTPVDVRIYLLRDPVRFQNASFAELWTNDAGTLEVSLVQPAKVVTVLPGKKDQPGEFYKLQLKSATWVGLMGLFSAEGQQGVEERKLCVSVDEADGAAFEFTGHKIVHVGAEPPKSLDEQPKEGEQPQEGETPQEGAEKPADEGAEKPADEGAEKPAGADDEKPAGADDESEGE